jgi:methionyl-tRNA formyltransferase
MKIFISGQKSFGAAALRLALELGHEVVGAAAPMEREPGRPDNLRLEAELWRVPVMDSRDLREATLPPGVDLILCAHSHAFVGRKTRRKASLGALGIHPSLLPLHRGRDAVKWTVKMRDRIAGASAFWLTDRVDAGPLAAQDWCWVRPEWSASDLWRKELFPMGLRLIAGVLNDIDGGRLVRIPQDEALATWEPALDPPRLSRPDLPELGDGSERFKCLRYLVEPGDIKHLGFTRDGTRFSL